ncbi:CRISPR-associated protein Cas4 [Proteiniclasticum sp. BAD-10]|uniref:CRISPR-associated exonuclease Cas4 n=1 Tax=Proteiniclasticum sediminis TaxID=2804028 RepID=A0A941HSD6_9CLOT|nr:CRISPR-associated protein Cas4 [Proteiniclasticum sediminis]MBR0577137.1 CRISPR-associated protein Cas4 [Proteiniclasticum sediminis]
MREDDYLMISGIQHYFYCMRQWALIHVEDQWQSNVYTVRGDIVHTRVDDPWFVESRNDRIIARSVALVSHKLSFYGVSDAVEYIKNSHGVNLQGQEGRFIIHPVEYKAGKPKADLCDRVQLCLQAMCLEEMYNAKIASGSLYYAKTRHRLSVEMTDELREITLKTVLDMHQIMEQGQTPTEKYTEKCDHCSMYNICLPKILTKKIRVADYIISSLESDEGSP